MAFYRNLLQLAACLLLIAFTNGCQPQHTHVGQAPSVDIDQYLIQTGDRPQYLIAQMLASPLKTQLQGCANQQPQRSALSIAHRGAPLQFPEHTVQSYRAAAQQGAKRIECDVAITKDDVLVCRHAQCDLHSTTNILTTPLAANCRQPFTPANTATGKSATVQCCASDVTFAEFKTLCGRMESHNPNAETVAQYQSASPSWRTDLYNQCGTLLSHQESITLIDSLGADFVPELKPHFLERPTTPLTATQLQARAKVADRLLGEYQRAGIQPARVWPQSFLWQDVEHWLQHWPAYAGQVVWLDGRASVTANGEVLQPEGIEFITAKNAGLNYIAPPLWVLLRHNAQTAQQFDLTQYALDAHAAGLQLVTWTLERSGPVAAAASNPRGYFRTLAGALRSDGDVYPMLHALVTQAQVTGVFSDWPATVTYYDNCLNSTLN